jgi:hypothetical protein
VEEEASSHRGISSTLPKAQLLPSLPGKLFLPPSTCFAGGSLLVHGLLARLTHAKVPYKQIHNLNSCLLESRDMIITTSALCTYLKTPIQSSIIKELNP